MVSKLTEYALLICGRAGDDPPDAATWASLAAAGTAVADDKLAQARGCDMLRTCFSTRPSGLAALGSCE
jgi:hypothetical protein